MPEMMLNIETVSGCATVFLALFWHSPQLWLGLSPWQMPAPQGPSASEGGDASRFRADSAASAWRLIKVASLDSSRVSVLNPTGVGFRLALAPISLVSLCSLGGWMRGEVANARDDLERCRGTLGA
eukprot:1901448-Pyramimonas_sp.AAC.2